MMTKTTGPKKRALVFVHLAFLILLLFIFFSDVIFFGKTLSTSQLLPGTTPHGPYLPDLEQSVGHSKKNLQPFSFDIGGNAWINEPNPYIVKRGISSCVIPTWDPAEGLGMPLAANPNAELFNPIKLFLNVHPSPFLQDLFFVFRVFVMGAFTYFFLAELGLSSFSSPIL